MAATLSIRRGFADISRDRQVHYRTAGAGGPRPLIVLHASPGSARMMEPTIAAFAATRQVYGLDTLGNGDSSPPDVAAPDIPYFARAHMEAIDTLGIGAFDLHGSHTGASIAGEIALAWPDRVRHLILDGVSRFGADERADLLAHHAPPLGIAPDASHLLWTWHFVRDAWLFWPWYKRDAAHLRGTGLPSPDAIHDKFVEVIKAARTFHLSYQAALAYEPDEPLGRIAVSTLVACAGDDMLLPYLAPVVALIPGATSYVSPDPHGSAGAATIARMTAFLDDRDTA